MFRHFILYINFFRHFGSSYNAEACKMAVHLAHDLLKNPPDLLADPGQSQTPGSASSTTTKIPKVIFRANFSDSSPFGFQSPAFFCFTGQERKAIFCGIPPNHEYCLHHTGPLCIPLYCPGGKCPALPAAPSGVSGEKIRFKI